MPTILSTLSRRFHKDHRGGGGLSWLLAAYAACLVPTAVSLAAGLFLGGERLESIWMTVALAFAAAMAEKARVRLPSSIEVSISLLPTLVAAILFGPLAGMIVG